MKVGQAHERLPMNRDRGAQTALVKECKKGVETAKLALWKSKAELLMRRQKFEQFNQKLLQEESRYADVLREIEKNKTYAIEAANRFERKNCRSILRIENPSTLLDDLAQAIMRILGYNFYQWDYFRQLLQDYDTFLETLLGFDDQFVDDQCYRFLLSIKDKHRLQCGIHDLKYLNKAAGSLIAWVLFIFYRKEQELDLETLDNQLVEFSAQKNALYLSVTEIEEEIRENSQKIDRLNKCIDENNEYFTIDVARFDDENSAGGTAMSTSSHNRKGQDSISRADSALRKAAGVKIIDFYKQSKGEDHEGTVSAEQRTQAYLESAAIANGLSSSDFKSLFIRDNYGSSIHDRDTMGTGSLKYDHESRSLVRKSPKYHPTQEMVNLQRDEIIVAEGNNPSDSDSGELNLIVGAMEEDNNEKQDTLTDLLFSRPSFTIHTGEAVDKKDIGQIPIDSRQDREEQRKGRGHSRCCMSCL
mmetsp:Transcript_20770/g.23482  ORF Transcript_20770/g.23482 Transcript_20770/m.23482 type:complete len:473 (+) Transcript_20770:39-1457(+)